MKVIFKIIPILTIQFFLFSNLNILEAYACVATETIATLAPGSETKSKEFIESYTAVADGTTVVDDTKKIKKIENILLLPISSLELLTLKLKIKTENIILKVQNRLAWNILFGISLLGVVSFSFSTYLISTFLSVLLLKLFALLTMIFIVLFFICTIGVVWVNRASMQKKLEKIREREAMIFLEPLVFRLAELNLKLKEETLKNEDIEEITREQKEIEYKKAINEAIFFEEEDFEKLQQQFKFILAETKEITFLSSDYIIQLILNTNERNNLESLTKDGNKNLKKLLIVLKKYKQDEIAKQSKKDKLDEFEFAIQTGQDELVSLYLKDTFIKQLLLNKIEIESVYNLASKCDNVYKMIKDAVESKT